MIYIKYSNNRCEVLMMIFRGRQLFKLNVGLVLAGGGAKGAYQAGIIRALWDLD